MPSIAPPRRFAQDGIRLLQFQEWAALQPGDVRMQLFRTAAKSRVDVLRIRGGGNAENHIAVAWRDFLLMTKA